MDGAVPGARLVQTAGLYRTAGRADAGFVWLAHDQNLARCRMGGCRLGRHVAVESCFAFLEKRFSAPDRHRHFAVGPGICPIPRRQRRLYVGSNCFSQGDLLVANKFFAKGDLDAYGSAGLLARALPTAVGPLLAVLFTHRSSRHHGDALHEQLKLLGLYALACLPAPSAFSC